MCKIRFCDSSFKILTKLNEKSILKHLELCGRECYQSGAKTTKDSCYSFVKRLIDNSEGSVLEHSSFSVKFICTRSLSHQLVRHRLCAFSEQSQRYCNYATKVPIYFIIPLWIPENDREFLLNYTVDSNIRFTDLPDEVQVRDSIDVSKSNGIIFPTKEFMYSRPLTTRRKMIELMKVELDTIRTMLDKYNYDLSIYDVDTLEELNDDNILTLSK